MHLTVHQKNLWRASLLLCTALLAGCAGWLTAKPVTLAVAQVDRGVMLWLPEAVLFEFGKAELDLREADAYLNRVAQLLREKSKADVLLEGHSDNVGSESFNLSLSTRRAEVLRKALLERGVPGQRMRAVGLGLMQPIAPNDTEVGRKLNRRVEIILLDEKLANLTAGEPENSFEQAFDRLKRLLEESALKK